MTSSQLAVTVGGNVFFCLASVVNNFYYKLVSFKCYVTLAFSCLDL